MNYYKKTTIHTRTTTITLKGGGSVTTTQMSILMQKAGIDITEGRRVDPTWEEDTTRGLAKKVIRDINREMMKLGMEVDLRA